MPDFVDTLPVELLLQIFSYLDSAAPSSVKSRREPSLHITASPRHTLKDISQTSRRWRRIVLPLLFRDSHIGLSEQPSAEASACPVCHLPNPGTGTDTSSKSIPYDIDAYHWALFSHAKEDDAHATPAPIDRNTRELSLKWAGSMYHALKNYLHFLEENDLLQHVRSLVLSTERMLPTSDRFPHYQARSDYRYRAAAEFWHHLFSSIGLSRVIIVACPSDMACLTNCAIDLFGDWAFSDMQYHLLELNISNSSTTNLSPIPPVDYASLSGIPEVYPGIAPSSILKLRPWSSLALNEGSFLKGYATYEYFERGPPSLIYSIKDLLASNRRAFHPHSQDVMDLRTLRKFTYTAILPFATHMDFRGLLPYIDELDVKLAPDVDSHILDDKERVGTAQLDDCWQELFTAYRLIIRPFRTFDIRPDGSPKLKRFICRDMMHLGLRDDLDDEFISLCLPLWAEMSTPGVFERQADVPHLPVDEFAQ